MRPDGASETDIRGEIHTNGALSIITELQKVICSRLTAYMHLLYLKRRHVREENLDTPFALVNSRTSYQWS